MGMRKNYRAGNSQTLELEQNYYDRHQGLYEPLTETDYAAILSYLPAVPRPTAILEIGCGSGAFGLRLQRRWASAINVGLDVSLNLLRQHAFLPVLADGRSLPFEDATFDLVAACASLHHIHSLPNTIAEVSRVLRPQGRVIFCEPNADHPYRRLVVDGGLLRKYFLQTSDESIFPEDLIKIMRDAGFSRLSFHYMTFQNAHPSLLGRIQYFVGRPSWPKALERFIHPWFVLVGEK